MTPRDPHRSSIHGAPGAPPANARRPDPARESAPEGGHRNGAPPAAGGGTGAVASIVGFAAAAVIGGAVAWSSGCRNEPPPGPSVDLPPRPGTLQAPATPQRQANASDGPSGSTAPSSSASAAPSSTVAAAEKPYTGPLLGGLMLQTVIFPKPEFTKRELGYVRLGGKVPVEPGIVKDISGKCSQGWYHLVDGGYVCARYATLDVKSPQIRLGITAPNLEDVLPYKYAHNSAHGTPLYRSVPSREEMLKYEPYLDAAKKAKRKADREKDKDDEASTTPAEPASGDALDKAIDSSAPADKPGEKHDKGAAVAKAESLGLFDLDAGAAPAEEEEKKPWWQQTADKSKPLHVTLDDLSVDADGTLAKRMVKGFFVAIDKQFGWNNRAWYKTTGGLVAPADRMYVVKPYTTAGIDFAEGVKQLGFITAAHASKYQLDSEQKTVKADGSVARFTAIGLTGAMVTNHGTVFRQTSEGWWMKAVDGTYTEQGPKPADLGPNEKWIDVNLTRKTMVALEGDKPIFGALVSPGKKSKDKEKDHSTIQGTFRIREKHIAVTMDGDGRAASDLPYSIEDVPYVEYFEGSYALHGAFWHNNFGHEMSHGCVNLSPLDAKKVFFWSEPKLPRGWHAVWSTPENRGTIVVVHE